MGLSYSFLLNVIVFFQIMYNEAQPCLNLYIREIDFLLKKKNPNTSLHDKEHYCGHARSG